VRGGARPPTPGAPNKGEGLDEVPRRALLALAGAPQILCQGVPAFSGGRGLVRGTRETQAERRASRFEAQHGKAPMARQICLSESLLCFQACQGARSAAAQVAPCPRDALRRTKVSSRVQ
jgi:hypothetical protein